MIQISETETQESIDHLFRHHAWQMVSVLCRIFGFDKLDLVEDAVQDAQIAALKKWPFSGFPDNPRAWLTEVAKNRVLDQLRREKKLDGTGDEDNLIADFTDYSSLYFLNEISDDQLRMIFACCHPANAPDAQVALTLKIVGGFSIAEIAGAYLSSEAAAAKIITRAKKKLRKNGVRLEMPQPSETGERLAPVLKVLYLIFNEGYAASTGDELIRTDLCFEAIRLCEFLSKHPVTASPKVHALAALFLFQGSRLASRVDQAGELVLLADQDRKSWDKEMIGRALKHFRLSASGGELSDFHLEAEIAALHTLAGTYKTTDWPRILKCYENLQKHSFSPVVELNRIVALGKINGPKNALAQLEQMDASNLQNYTLFHIIRAQFLSDLGEAGSALESYKTAMSLTQNEAILKFLRKKSRRVTSV